jgi:hypothetical protein
VTGAQWGHVLDKPGVVLDVAQHGKKVGVRFRLGDPRSPGVLFNEAIFPERQPGGEPDVLPLPSAEVLGQMTAICDRLSLG